MNCVFIISVLRLSIRTESLSVQIDFFTVNLVFDLC